MDDRVFVNLFLLLLLLLGAVFVAFAGRATFRALARLRRVRYSLGEFIVLVVTTGLGMGLPAKALPEEAALGAVMGASVAVGLFLFWGGLPGLRAADRLGLESPRRRALVLLRGVLLFPALAGALIAVGGIPHVEGLWGEPGTGGILLSVAWVAGTLLCSVHGVMMLDLLRRAREAEGGAGEQHAGEHEGVGLQDVTLLGREL